jgi:hypothetical protein
MSTILRRAMLATAITLSLTTSALCDAADAYRISEPSLHGKMAIFLVHGASDGRPVPLTLQETIPKQQARVVETGTVNELVIENLSDQEIFIQAGEIVTGGKQDRVISSNLILPPHSGPIPMAAFCVEPGRWAARDGEDGRSFAVASTAMPASGTRRVAAAAALSYAPQTPLAERSATPAAQSQVWEDGRRVQFDLGQQLHANLATPSAPTSLASTLDSEALERATTKFVEILSPLGLDAEDVVGYVFVLDGKPVSGEIFASHALFRKLWPKLARAAIVDAIKSGDGGATASAVPSPNEVTRFLAPARTDGIQQQHLTDYVSQNVFEDGGRLLIETRRPDASWVTKTYQAN